MTRVAVAYDGSWQDATPDEVVQHVLDALRRLGHEAEPMALPGDLGKILALLRDRAPEVVFNLTESLCGREDSDVHFAVVLDLLGIPFTGADPVGLMLSQDKVLTKKLLSFDSLPFPRFAAFYDEALEFVGDLRFPLFVKPVRQDASIGIDATSVVRKSLDLLEKVRQVRTEYGGAALVEEYIEGREVSVAVLGHEAPEALPAIEVDFTGFPRHRPRIMDQRAKFEEGTAEYRGTKAIVAQVEPGLRVELERMAVTAFRAMRLRDYGRIDFRVDRQGRAFILEANPNPYLEKASELALAAEAAGLGYDGLIGRILESALERARDAKGRKRGADAAGKADGKA